MIKKIISLLLIFFLVSFEVYAACPGGVCYVRTDGGTGTQCNGGSDASSASAPNCAFSHPAWALGGFGTTGVMTGGDDLIIGPGSYMIGYGMPNTVGCSATARQNCTLNSPPSGTPTNPTRILGSDYAGGCATKPELWGTEGNRYVLNISNVSNLETQCLELTDHANCGQRTGVLCTDWNTNGALGTWASIGLFGYNVSNFKAYNLDVHGFASFGGNLSGLTGINEIKNSNFVGNYMGGLDGDTTPRNNPPGGGPFGLLYGNLVIDKTKIKWNGCQEVYPRTGTQNNLVLADYGNCTGNENGGYGEGFSGGSSGAGGANGSSGSIRITRSDMSNNTSDGIDFLYSDNNLDFYMDKTKVEANAGNQLKITGRNVEVTNTLISGNCSYFSKANKVYTGGPAWNSNCRSGGVPISLTPVLGTTMKFRNITHFSADDSDGSAFLEISNRNGTCNGTETYDFKNIIAVNQAPGFWGSGFGFYNVDLTGSCATAWGNRTVTYSNLNGWGSHPGTGNTYTSPAWVGAINNALASNAANVLLTSNVGGGNASTYWNTSTDINNTPQNASIDQGAFQYGTDSSNLLAQSGQACISDSDCATGDCTNFACSGSCTANGGACITGATCCSAYCNGSSLCAVPPSCGDGIVQAGEVCDTSGPNVNGSNCVLQGFTGGTLGCASTCLAFDTSSCTSTTVFPLTPVLDDFNRANGAVGSNWTTLDLGMEVSSNQAVMAAGTGNWYSAWAGTTFGADVESYVKVVTKPANGSVLILNVRADTINDNAYFLILNVAAGTDTISLYKRVADVETILGSAYSQEISSNDSIGISVVGSAVKAYYKASAGSWTQIISQTDTSVTAAGQNNIYTDSSALVIDDFGGGSINPVVCGNGLKEGSEVCDGADLAGSSCVSQGYASGTLACASNCLSFDTSSCVTASSCGNNTKETGEICDGTDLDSQTCSGLGYASGTLTCSSDCLSFNTNGCVSGGSGIVGGMILK